MLFCQMILQNHTIQLRIRIVFSFKKSHVFLKSIFSTLFIVGVFLYRDVFGVSEGLFEMSFLMVILKVILRVFLRGFLCLFGWST